MLFWLVDLPRKTPLPSARHPELLLDLPSFFFLSSLFPAGTRKSIHHGCGRHATVAVVVVAWFDDKDHGFSSCFVSGILWIMVGTIYLLLFCE